MARVECGELVREPCRQCGGEGMIAISECPKTSVGHAITEAVNVAGLCGGGILPIHGGLLDQSAWFVDLWQTLKGEEARIDAQKAERISNGF